MIVLIAIAGRAVVLVLADVKLAAQDGLDALCLGSVKEMHRTIDVAVIGHGDGLLADRRHAVNEFLHVAGAVEEGVFGMQMEVGEFGHG